MIGDLLKRISPPGFRARPGNLVRSEGPLLTNDVLEALQRLAIASQRIQTGGFAGEHRSKLRGVSPEFADFKSYSPGDDFRRVDWNLYARFDELFVRLSEVTTDLSVHFLIDASGSMDWASREDLPSKFRFARQIAGAIGYIALWRFDRVLVTPFAEQLRPGFGPGHGRSEVGPLIRYLTECTAAGSTDLNGALANYLHRHPAPGLMILISDLLSSEAADLGVALRSVRSRGWEISVIHVVDDGELEPAPLFAGDDHLAPITIVDAESNGTLMITPNRPTLDRYRETVSDWLGEIEAICSEHGARYLRLATSEPVGAVVMRQLHRRGLLS
jgi:uncharacterized protein (DUF58 family)